MAIKWKDNGFRYGAVTRWLHWTMAMLLAWQFMGMGVKIIVGKAPITAFWVGTHKGIGVILLALIVMRAVWGLYNIKTRPAHGRGLGGMAAKAGHLMLYTLMLIIPAMGLLRQYGSGKPLDVFGVRLIDG